MRRNQLTAQWQLLQQPKPQGTNIPSYERARLDVIGEEEDEGDQEQSWVVASVDLCSCTSFIC